MKDWDKSIQNFISLANKHKVRMLLVGGGAVNFHGYQRHSTDIDFWLDMDEDNLKKLLNVFQEMDYDIQDFPKKVKEKQQNISVKFSPADLDLELITNFSINKTFDQAYKDAEQIVVYKNPVLKWRVISFEDLVASKIKSGRAKDLLDIQELKKINKF